MVHHYTEVITAVIQAFCSTTLEDLVHKELHSARLCDAQTHPVSSPQLVQVEVTIGLGQCCTGSESVVEQAGAPHAVVGSTHRVLQAARVCQTCSRYSDLARGTPAPVVHSEFHLKFPHTT